MHPYQRCAVRRDVPVNDGDMFRIVEGIAETDRPEPFPVTGIERRFDAALHEPVILSAPGDEVGNRADFEIVQLGEGDQFGKAGHGAVFIHDFADHTGRIEAGHAGNIYRRLCMPGADECAAFARNQREDVSG